MSSESNKQVNIIFCRGGDKIGKKFPYILGGEATEFSDPPYTEDMKFCGRPHVYQKCILRVRV